VDAHEIIDRALYAMSTEMPCPSCGKRGSIPYMDHHGDKFFDYDCHCLADLLIENHQSVMFDRVKTPFTGNADDRRPLKHKDVFKTPSDGIAVIP
jgi:hypothetical protein